MRVFCIFALSALVCTACGGRAHLDEETGLAYHRLWQAQIESQPRIPMAPLTASEAQGIMGNYQARYAKASKSEGASSGGGISFSSFSADFGSSTSEMSGGARNPIKLQAK